MGCSGKGLAGVEVVRTLVLDAVRRSLAGRGLQWEQVQKTMQCIIRRVYGDYVGFLLKGY